MAIEKQKKKFFLTKAEIIFIFVILAFIVIFIINRKEIKEIFIVLGSGKWYFVLLALVFQLFDYYVFTFLYYFCFKLVNVKSRVRELLPLMFASVFANLVPSGGTSATALFIHDAASRKESVAKATIGALLVQFFDFLAFLVVLGLGLMYLLSQDTLKTYQVVASSIMILAIGSAGTMLAISLWQETFSRKIFGLIQRFVNGISNRIKKKSILKSDWADKVSIDLQDAARAIASNPKTVLKIIVVALGNHLFDILTVLALFLAFNQEIRLGTIVTGYAMTHLFTTIAITPQGIGVVESVMVFMYSSLGITLGSATVISLAYRGLKLWIPLFIGFIILRKLRMFNGNKN